MDNINTKKVMFSKKLILSTRNDLPNQFYCLDEITWNEVPFGDGKVFLRELNGWILNKNSVDLIGDRPDYDLFGFEYSKDNKKITFVQNGEYEEYFFVSDNSEDLLLFLNDYELDIRIVFDNEIRQLI